jgi:hypothetical protein
VRSAGDAAILCRTREFLTTASLNGGNGFWYHFTATPLTSLNMGDIPYMGSFHGSEVPFVFGYPAELASDGERALSKAMGCYWVNFASSGNPNYGPSSCSNLPEWREISTTAGTSIGLSVLTVSRTFLISRARGRSQHCIGSYAWTQAVCQSSSQTHRSRLWRSLTRTAVIYSHSIRDSEARILFAGSFVQVDTANYKRMNEQEINPLRLVVI